MPALHAYLAIDDSAKPHTAEFAKAARSPRGDRAMADGAVILAGIAADLLGDKDLLLKAKEEWRKSTQI
ncbi:MAG: hypothetical protein R2880_21000 [Deinococcales bacterium]